MALQVSVLTASWFQQDGFDLLKQFPDRGFPLGTGLAALELDYVAAHGDSPMSVCCVPL
jgi:hypothetical protein